MNDSIPNAQRGIPVKCLDALSKFNEKTVLFRWQRGADFVPLLGKLIVHPGSDCFYVDIEYRGFLYDFEHPNTLGHCLHLSQEFADSIVPAEQSDSEVDFIVGLPFEQRHYVHDIPCRQ